MLRVVRYNHGLGVSQHELAYVEQTADDRFNYIFAGREHVGPLDEYMASTIPVNPRSMTSSEIVMAVVQRDIDGLRQKVQVNVVPTIDYTVRVSCRLLRNPCSYSPHVILQDFDIAHDVITQQQAISIVHPRRSRSACVNVEHNSIGSFIAKYANERGRLQRICADIQQLPCKDMSTTKILKKAVPNIGTVIDLNAMHKQVDDFLNLHELTPLTEFNLRESVGYVRFKDNAIDTLLITTTGALGNYFAVAISVDYIASNTKSVAHGMIAQLKQHVSRRKQKSYVFTQASKTPKALKFWKGRLTQSKWANVMVALMHEHCAEYKIYEDTMSLIS